MINASELRIGNWVREHDAHELYAPSPVIVDLKILGLVNDGGFSPIPLTTEILEKAGFELDASYDIPEWHHKSGFWFHDAFFNNTTYSIRLMNNIDVELYFLHQLQNLYFALTGEELDIKL